MNIAFGIDTIKIFTSQFQLSQQFADHLFHQAQKNKGEYIDKDLHQIKRDFKFLDILDKEVGFKYCYFDGDGVYLPAKKTPYFCFLDCDQLLRARQNHCSPFETDFEAISGHIRITLSRINELPTLKIETELSRFQNPNFFNFSLLHENDEIEQAFKTLEEILLFAGVKIDVGDCRLSRIDVSEDIQAPYNIETLEKMIDDHKWKKIQRYKYEGGIIHLSNAKNPAKKRQFSYYDKTKKILEVDIEDLKKVLHKTKHEAKRDIISSKINSLIQHTYTQDPSKHHLRREMRFMNTKAIREDLGLQIVRDLYEKGDQVCLLAKKRINEFISYQDIQYLDLSSEITQSLNSTKNMFSYFGIIGMFGSLKIFEEMLMNGRFTFIDCTDKNKRIFIKNLRKTEKEAVNFKFRIASLSCDDLKTLPDQYDPQHNFKDPFWYDEDADLDEPDDLPDEFDDLPDESDDLPDDLPDESDDLPKPDDVDLFLFADNFNSAPLQKENKDHPQHETLSIEDRSSVDPLGTDDGKIFSLKSIDNVDALHNHQKTDRFSQKGDQFNHFRKIQYQARLKQLRDIIQIKGKSFDDWIDSQLFEYHEEINKINPDSVAYFEEDFINDCSIKWINLQDKLKNAILEARETALLYLDTILYVNKYDCKNDDDFEICWDHFWHQADPSLKEIVLVLGMKIEIKNVAKLKLMRRDGLI